MKCDVCDGQGWTQDAIGVEVRLSQSTVSRIVRNAKRPGLSG